MSTSIHPTPVPLSDGTDILIRYSAFASCHVVPRNIDVWFPPAYATVPARRFPVVYMHDGQNLFDPVLAYTGVDWGVDEALKRLIRAGRSSGAIIVAIWNSDLRWREYMPAKPLRTPPGLVLQARFREAHQGDPLSDRYLKFIVEELKPFIDATYRTMPDQPHTFVMGSSMGGLVSAYALVEYPEVFGGIACLSTHWPVGEDIVATHLGRNLPRAGRHRLYFDFGGVALDAGYAPYQRQFDVFVQAAGYLSGVDWLTQRFPGADHSETAWRARIDVPLAFLLKP